MPTRKRVTIFIMLFSLTVIIFSSSTLFAKLIDFETKVQAKTSPAFVRNHMVKSTGIQLMETVHELERFSSAKPNLPIFLTFDDGPTEFTHSILTILDHYQVQSTFFMLYGNIQKRPDIVKAVAEKGHTIGCHGVSHKVSAFYRTPTSPREEMEACSRAVEEIIGTNISLVRVPFGSSPHLTTAQKMELEQGEFIMWDWNVDSMDWKISSSEQMVQIVLKQVEKVKEKGKVPVVLFHDKEITVNALPAIIEALTELGYDFKPITHEDEPLQFKQKK